MIGHGTTLRRSENGLNWLEIGQIISLTPPSLSRETLETTHMESEYKEYIGGQVDAGEISLEINFFEPFVTTGEESEETNHHLVFGDFKSGAVVLYRLDFPDKRTKGGDVVVTAWEVPSVVSAFSINTPASDRVTASVTLKVAGKPEFKEIAI
jgi:hypothetical protein